MRRKTVSGIMLSLLLVGMLILTFNVQPVKASGTIYIGADYTFTSNIYEPIVVTANNIVIDGNGYTLQGTGAYESRGIDLSHRSNVTIKNTNIKKFWYGIWLNMSSSNIISGNNITNNRHGIWLEDSSNNTLRNNDASNNTYNFGVYGTHAYYIQDIDDSNIVNGKPVYYLVNRRDMTVPLDAGYVALINCTRMTVRNLNLANNGQGVILVFTTNSTITKNNVSNIEHFGINLYRSSNNNTISGNSITSSLWHGIHLVMSSNNNISENNITNSGNGISLFDSSENGILKNNIANSNFCAIEIHRSENGIIEANNITSNYYGVGLAYCFNHTFFHNNFINNTRHMSFDSENTWDDGYPSGGNYWSDYTGVDVKSSLYQNETGSDGIGDTPYVIDGNNQDNYPLMQPYVYVCTLISLNPMEYTAQVGDSFTIDVNITDVIGLCGYEFKLLWNTTILDCVDSKINRIWYPDDWVIRDEILENYNSTHGRYFVAYLPLPSSEFNGNTILVSLTFEAMETGNCTLHLYDIELGDCSANPIEYTFLDGSVTIVPFVYSSDLDGDGFVGISDISVAALAFGSFPGHPRWNPIADLNKDGWVDISDIVKIAVDFGKTV